MKHLGMFAALALGLIISGVGVGAAADPVYVNTKGEVISESEIGDYCRPIEVLPDGKLMVFSKSRIDLALYEQRLLANGVTDVYERKQMVQGATSDDCERKAGNKCSDGTCSSGSCKTKNTGGMTSCSCQ